MIATTRNVMAWTKLMTSTIIMTKKQVRAALKMVQDDADLSPNDGDPQGLACLPDNINIII